MERYKELISVSELEVGYFNCPKRIGFELSFFDLKLEANLDAEKLWAFKLGGGQCAKCQP